MLLFGMSNTGRWCTCVRVLRGLGVVEANLQDLFGMPSVEPGAGFEAGKRQEQRPLGDVRHEKAGGGGILRASVGRLTRATDAPEFHRSQASAQ